MLKDLMHAIFKEDVEEEIEETESKEGEKEVIEEVHETITEQLPTKEETRAAFVMNQPIEQPVSEPVETIVAETVQEESNGMFDGLDVDSIASKPKRKSSLYHYDRSKISRKRKAVEEVEYQAVISPIFGNMEDSQKEFDKVHDAIQLPKPENDAELVEIISPMYGNHIPTPKPVDSIPSYDEATKKGSKPKMYLDDMLSSNSGTNQNSETNTNAKKGSK